MSIRSGCFDHAGEILAATHHNRVLPQLGGQVAGQILTWHRCRVSGRKDGQPSLAGHRHKHIPRLPPDAWPTMRPYPDRPCLRSRRHHRRTAEQQNWSRSRRGMAATARREGHGLPRRPPSPGAAAETHSNAHQRGMLHLTGITRRDARPDDGGHRASGHGEMDEDRRQAGARDRARPCPPCPGPPTQGNRLRRRIRGQLTPAG